jgi:hypothetical protein
MGYDFLLRKVIIEKINYVIDLHINTLQLSYYSFTGLDINNKDHDRAV